MHLMSRARPTASFDDPAVEPLQVLRLQADAARGLPAVQSAERPLTRLEVAEAVDIARRLAAHPTGRPGGPGAGLPARWYRTSDVQLDVTIPPRRNDIAAASWPWHSSTLGQTVRTASPPRASRACGEALRSTAPNDQFTRLSTPLADHFTVKVVSIP
jgi:hypothetical protein